MKLNQGMWVGRADDDVQEAKPIGREDHRPELALELKAPTLLRRSFDIRHGVSQAELTVTARGVYEVFVNGTAIGDEVLSPGWTDYRQRIYTRTHVVTPLLREGKNVIAAVVADGWYSGFVGFDRGRHARLWGQTPQLWAQLDYMDTRKGHTAIRTDSQWRWSTGEFIYADLQMGEMHDARAYQAGWMLPTFNDDTWQPVHCERVRPGSPKIVESIAPPMRVTERISPSIVKRDASRLIIDFGQNLVGVVELSLVSARYGDQITIRHAEVTNQDGTLYTENLRSAAATDIYICNDDAYQRFRPRFTFHGFRFAEISGDISTIDIESIKALVIHTDSPVIGHFTSSNQTVNRLYENIDWTIRGNMLDVPTDCPQRDERLGWLADAQLIMPTAASIRDVSGFIEKWSQDLRDSQFPDGAFPDVAPIASIYHRGAPGWSDAGAIVPWTNYLYFGSTRVLRDNYRSISRWVHYLAHSNPDFIRTHAVYRNYGDWLSIGATTPKEVISTAYFALSAQIAAKAATALGKRSDARKFGLLRQQIGRAFADNFVSVDGTVHGDTQTAYAMALAIGLVPASMRAEVERRFSQLVERDGKVCTGIHGTRFLAPALSQSGRNDLAYKLLLREEFPSWLNMIENGATTIWERWDGWTSENGFQDPRMNSFNHAALGSIGEWLFRYVGGLNPVSWAPAFQHSIIRPNPNSALRSVSVSRRLAHGDLEVNWSVSDQSKFALDVQVPHGCTATIFVPTTAPSSVSETLSSPRTNGLKDTEHSATSWVERQVTEGNYSFESELEEHWCATPFSQSIGLRHSD